MTQTSSSPESDAVDAPLAPTPIDRPIVGSTLRLLREPVGFLDDLAAHGNVVSYTIAGQRFTTLLHPEHVQTVLVGRHDAFRRWSGEEWGSAFAGYGADGLLLSEGEQWRRQRGIIQDAFTVETVESYAEAMVTTTADRVADWTPGERIDLGAELSDLTLAILTHSLFDLDLAERGDVVRRAVEALNDRANSTSPVIFLPNWLPTPSKRRLDRSMAALEDLFDDLIAARRGGADRDDLLSLLLSADEADGEGLTEREIRDQLLTFLFAGHETTALALTYTLHAVGHDADSRERLLAEIEAVLGDDDPTLSDLPAMEYTEATVREALRKYPPAYSLFREAAEDVVVGDYRIPKGSKVTMPQIHVHRDERFWEDPEAFRPERWLGDDDDRPEYAYFPFGGGPRHCIGMRMAMLELRLALPTILQRVALEPTGDRELSFSPMITLHPSEPVEAVVGEPTG